VSFAKVAAQREAQKELDEMPKVDFKAKLDNVLKVTPRPCLCILQQAFASR
jgi:hypothetical protein